MTNRDPAACRRAVDAAWKRERELVLEGKGTRDWSEEQQLDIIELGKAFDDDGFAFEGHHMKNVKAYPEHQGNPDNIQLLSIKEHLAAHKGDYHNPTNWYYDPDTSEYVDLEGNAPVACKAIKLSKPIAIEQKSNAGESKESQQTISTESNQESGLWNKLKHCGRMAGDFIKEHPGETAGIVFSVVTLIHYAKNNKSFSSQKKHRPFNTMFHTRQQTAKSSIIIPKVINGIGEIADDVKDNGIDGLRSYSKISTMGYNTRVPVEKRHEILQRASQKYGKKYLGQLLQYLINTRSGNKEGKYGRAIEIWKEDYDFLDSL